MKDYFRLFVIAFALLVSTNAQAQTWDLLAPANGLPSDSILDMSSRNDTTYVLHPHAISRFTGLWQYFPDTFGAEAGGERNNLLYFDSQGGLWIGRTNGIYFVPSASLNSPNPKAQNRTKTFFPDADSIPPVVTAIYRDRNQVLWIGTLNRGLLRFGSGTNCRSIKPIAGSAFFAKRLESIPEVTDIVEDSSSLWIGTFDGLIHINSCGASLGAFLGGRWVRHLLVDEHRRVWAATNSGLYVATDHSMPKYELVWTPLSCRDTTRARLPMPRMTAVIQDFSGAIWATSDTNVYRYQQLDSPNPNEWKPEVFECRDEWPAQVTGLIRLSMDRAGFIWVASYLDGILRYNMLWETIKLTDLGIGAQSDIVNILYRSPIDRGLYVGTKGGMAQRDTVGLWKQIPLPSGCSSVHSFFHDPAGFLLMSISGCGNSNLVAFDGMRERPIRCITSCPTDNVFLSIIKLPSDTLWLAGSDSLWSTRIDNLVGIKTFTAIRSSLTLFHPFKTLLLQDSTFIWMGTESSGLVRYDIKNRRVDNLTTVGRAFASRSSRSLHLDSTGVLWIGTDRGLTRLIPPFDFNAPNWQDEIETGGAVNFVFSTQNGGIWFDDRDGVAHYSQEAGVTHFPRPVKPTEGGPASKEVQTGVNLIENGRESFWFGTDAGLSIFHGDLIPPETRITRPVFPDTTLTHTVQIASNTLFVQYEGGDNLTASERIAFRTKLVRLIDGRDGTVIQQKPFSPDRAEQLFFLESGCYRYEVQARDQSGNIDPTPACLLIEVDIDAPSVVITQPAATPNTVPWVPGCFVVEGSVVDADLDSFRVEIVNPSTGDRLLPAVTKRRAGKGKVLASVRDSTLAEFDVRKLNEEKIIIRVTAADTLKHSRSDSVAVRVDAVLPKLEVLRPADGTQVADSVNIDFRFNERHHRGTLEFFFKKMSTDTTRRPLKNTAPDKISSDPTDSLFSTAIPITFPFGKEDTLIFLFRDLAGNLATDVLTLFRAIPAVGSASDLRKSQDDLVQVHLPPGKSQIIIRISPVDSAFYFDSAISFGLQPKSRAYLIEPQEAFGREATLTMKIADAFADRNRLAIFRQESDAWNHVGGRFSSENGQSTLRAVINRGGVYLAAVGEAGSFQAGNVTCLPRMFSPGRESYAAFTDVVFTLERESSVSIRIYNTAGRQVRSLINDGEVMPPGRHAVRWDGYGNEKGERLRSGIYIVVVRTDAFTETKTVVIQK